MRTGFPLVGRCASMVSVSGPRMPATSPGRVCAPAFVRWRTAG